MKNFAIALSLAIAFTSGCKKGMDQKLLDEGKAAVESPCACIELPDEKYFPCLQAAQARMDAADAALVKAGYYQEHGDSEELEAIYQAGKKCRETVQKESDKRRDRQSAAHRAKSDAGLMESLDRVNAAASIGTMH